MAVWSNRILIVLGALGIFISGVLSYTTKFKLEPPCGGHMGCSIVQNSQFAYVGGISVSYIGLAGYVALLSLAVARAFASGRTFRSLSMMGFVMAAAGTLFSLYLTYCAIGLLGQKCVWCLSSLAVIIVTTIAHAALLQSESPAQDDAPKSMLLAVGSLMLSFGAIGWRVQGLERQFDLSVAVIDTKGATLEKLLPMKAKTIGDDDAKVTLIEFADMNCPTCRSMHTDVKRIVNSYDGRLRLGYRHFPLVGQEGHETSLDAAAIAELAADKGMFWRYLDEVMDGDNKDRIKTLQGLIAVAGEAGLNRGEIVTVFQSEEAENKEIAKKYWERVDEDMDLALGMAINSTPTFILFAEGAKPLPIAGRDIEQKLREQPYKGLLGR